MQLPPEAADSLAEDELAALGIEELLRLGSPTRVEAGPGAVARLGDCARDLGGKRLFVVTDAGLREAGGGGAI